MPCQYNNLFVILNIFNLEVCITNLPFFWIFQVMCKLEVNDHNLVNNNVHPNLLGLDSVTSPIWILQ